MTQFYTRYGGPSQVLPEMGPLVGGPNVLSMGMAEARGAKLMIFGAHVIVYSKDVAADRAFFSQVLGFSSVDAGADG